MRFNIKRVTLLCSIVLACGYANAQSVDKSVVATAGGETTVGGYSYVWTVGEAVIGSATSTGYIITEGFLPLKSGGSVGVSNIAESAPSVKLYPNPTTGKLILDVKQEQATKLNIQVLDISGRTIKATESLPNNASFNHQMDFTTLPSGTYFVILSTNEDIVFTSKVVKQ